MRRKSLHNAHDLEEIIERINSLTPKTSGRWGRMNVCEMMQHCRFVLEVPCGKKKLPRKNFIIRIIGFCTKTEMIVFNNGIPRNMPTFDRLRCTNTLDFETERAQLLAVLAEYCQLGKENSLPASHVLFGKLNQKQWGFMEYKHLHHHLKQFDV